MISSEMFKLCDCLRDSQQIRSHAKLVNCDNVKRRITPATSRASCLQKKNKPKKKNIY